MTEAAIEFFGTMDHDSCPIFNHLYPSIALEMGIPPHEHGDEDVIVKVWQHAKAVMTTKGKGENMKRDRWWSFETTSRQFFGTASMTYMVLLYMGMRRKWWPSLESTPLLDNDIPAEDKLDGLPDGGEAAGVGVEAKAGGAAEQAVDAEDLNHGVSAEGPSAHRMSTEAARKEVQRRRTQCASTMQYCCRVLAQPLNVQIWRSMVFASRTLQHFFNDMIPKLKKRETVKRLHVELAQGRRAARQVELVAKGGEGE